MLASSKGLWALHVIVSTLLLWSFASQADGVPHPRQAHLRRSQGFDNGFRRRSSQQEDAALVSRKLTGILPVLRENTELLKIFFATCKNTVHPTYFDAVWLITPAEDFDWFSEVLRNASKVADLHHFQVVTETDILPEFYSGPGAGWLRQQDLKLASAKYIRTDFYLLLDADTVCLEGTPKALQECISYPEGKSHGVVYTSMMPTYHDAVQSGFHNSTAMLFGLPVDLSKINSWLNYTPQILSRQVMLQIGKWLEDRDPGHRELTKIISEVGRPGDPRFHHGLTGTDVTEGTFWTEFMLYQLGAISAGVWNEYHIEERCDSHDAAQKGCHCNLRTYVDTSKSLENVIKANEAGEGPPIIFLTIADDIIGKSPSEMASVKNFFGIL